MNLRFTKILLLVFLSTNIFFAQRANNTSQYKRSLSISGIVKDAKTSQPVEYANIVIFNMDSTQVNGGITNTNGEFKIEGNKPGSYYAKITFIGFESSYVDNITLNRNSRSVDLGEIFISPSAYQLEDAKVVANKSPVEYKIDKKVINVSEQSTTISGSAVDVLENVPSVRVDIEGNVSLRGSGSFTLLIDGRPTILDASDALQQIPATSIESIEIITNPSAKYDPEGVSGIINIISKENDLNGFSGVVNANIGLDNKYGADFTTSYRSKNFSLNLGANYRKNTYPGSSNEYRETYTDSISSFLNSFGDNNRGRTGWSIKGGADLNLSPNDLLGFSFRYGDRNSESTSNINYHNYTVPETVEKYYTSNNTRERTGNFFSSNLNYKHTFGPNQHELIAEGMYQKRNSDELTVNEYIQDTGEISSGRKNIETGPGERIRAKLDYSYPMSDDAKFETGGQYEKNSSQDDTRSLTFDALEYIRKW